MNPIPSTFEFLLSNEPFAILDSSGQQKIARRLKTLHFRPGEYLLRAGEKQDSGLYIVTTGQLHVLIPQSQGPEQLAGVIEVGNFFGEMELITGQTRQASVRAATSGELVYLLNRDFETLVAEYPELLNQLGEVIQRRFRRNHLVKILPEFLGPIPPKRQSRKGFTGLPIAPPASLIVALVTLNALRPGLLPGFGMPILVFSIAVLGAYLMTLSQVEYLRWRGRGIGLQALGSITNYWIGKGWGNY